MHYFGRWGKRVGDHFERVPGDGWKEALQEYRDVADALHAGRKPRPAQDDDLTVKQLCNRFLTAKHRKLASGELKLRSFNELKATAFRVASAFGKSRVVEDLDPEDFANLRAEIAKTCGPVRLGNEVVRTKSIFKFAFDNRLTQQPVNFGSEFKKPDKNTLRVHRAKGGKKLFTANELRQAIDLASPGLKAAILLGINCGLGNTDVADLGFQHLDLGSGWLEYPRGKTGIERRCPLWPETVEALNEAINARPTPLKAEDADVVLLASSRERLVRITEKSRTDSVSRSFGQLLRKLKINGRRGLGFYSLRHTFATIGLQTGDRDAVRALMGHIENDMLATYNESGPSDERRLAVTNHVRDWLWSNTNNLVQ